MLRGQRPRLGRASCRGCARRACRWRPGCPVRRSRRASRPGAESRLAMAGGAAGDPTSARYPAPVPDRRPGPGHPCPARRDPGRRPGPAPGQRQMRIRRRWPGSGSAGGTRCPRPSFAVKASGGGAGDRGGLGLFARRPASSPTPAGSPTWPWWPRRRAGPGSYLWDHTAVRARGCRYPTPGSPWLRSRRPRGRSGSGPW